jgi:23S rRNA (guanine745-N1)-methyltransferase
MMLDRLACPVCGEGLARRGATLTCPRGHSYDVARQGYVNLLAGDAPTGLGDTPEMVAARAEFLGAGHYDPLSAALAEAVGDASRVLDAGAGPGHHLAAVVEAAPGRRGLALDASKHAARRAARVHPRVEAAVADVWRGIPVRDGAADAVLDVFAPRHGREFARALAPGGVLVVVTPTERHLRELARPLGLLAVDDRKQERLDRELGEHFAERDRRQLEFTMTLDRGAVGQVVAMGPSAHHTDPAAAADVPDPVRVTASMTVRTYRPRS